MIDFFERTIGLWIILGLIFIVVGIQYCGNTNSNYPTQKGIGFDVIEIDSCEYLIGGSAYQGYMAHKGNCKFCAKRKLENNLKDVLK